jgi:hypothetical protein
MAAVLKGITRYQSQRLAFRGGEMEVVRAFIDRDFTDSVGEYGFVCYRYCNRIPLALARKLKGISQNGLLTEKKIDELVVSKMQTPPKQVKISHKIIRKYFADDVTPQERDSVIDKALDEWFKRHPEKSNVVPLNQDINAAR